MYPLYWNAAKVMDRTRMDTAPAAWWQPRKPSPTNRVAGMKVPGERQFILQLTHVICFYLEYCMK